MTTTSTVKLWTVLLVTALVGCGEAQSLYSPCESAADCDPAIQGQACVVDPYGGGAHFCSGACRVDNRKKGTTLKVGGCYEEQVSEGGGERSDCKDGCCLVGKVWDDGQWGAGLCAPFAR